MAEALDIRSHVPAPNADRNTRLFYGVPQQAANWTGEYEERGSQWFELFVDLVLVVAWSNITDALYESELGIISSLFMFWLTVNLVQCAWLLYSQYQSKFIDESFVHTIQLFVYILGLAGIAAHIGAPELATELSVSLVLQKIPLIVMYSVTAFHSKRARPHMGYVACLQTASALICAVVAFTQPREYTPFVVSAWTLVVVLELPCDLIYYTVLQGRFMVPFNIDHVVERQNEFIMIALGESILSAMLKYGDLPAKDRTPQFYICMALALLLAFSIGLLFYNVQPSRHANAYRRSFVRAVLVYFATCSLAPCILLISVGVKHAMNVTVTADGMISSAHTWMIYGNVALVLHVIFWIRLGHFWGIEPKESDPAVVKKLAYQWWTVFAVWPVVPICIAAVATTRISALWNMGLAAAVCGALVVIETCFTTWLAATDAASAPHPETEAALIEEHETES